MSGKRPRRRLRWVYWPIAILALLILAVLIVDVLELPVLREEVQGNFSSGKVRRVVWLLGLEIKGSERDTAVSEQLAGETVSDRPQWYPMTISYSVFFKLSIGHSSFSSGFVKERDMPQLWSEGGFTEDAKTESARRFLLATRPDQDQYWNLDYMRALRLRVEAMRHVPLAQRVTTVAGLPPHDVVLPHTANASAE
jgi:hypothetical protein